MAATALDLRSQYPPRFPAIEQINGGEFRTYRVPNGKCYPSQSSVVKVIQDPTILENWRKRVGEKEANRISSHAARRGTAVHTLSELYLTNDPNFERKKRSAMPDQVAPFKSIERELVHVSDFRAIELQMYSDELRIAGTVDLIATYREKLCIIDYKTSGKKKPRSWIDHYFLQAAGYAQMWKEHTGEQIEELVILMAVDGIKECQVFAEPIGDNLKELKKARLKFYQTFGI